MRARSWVGVVSLAGLAGLIVGCGGGGGDASALTGGGGGPGDEFHPDLEALGTARVDVDLAHNKIKVTPVGQNQSRSLYTANSVSITADTLSTDPGELTIRKMKVHVANNTADSIGVANGAKMIIDRVTDEDNVFFQPSLHSQVDTVIGPGTSAADGPGLNVTITQPTGIDRDTDGTIYIAGLGDGTVRKFSDSFVTRIATGISSPSGLAVLPGSGFVFILEQSTHNLVRIPTGGGAKFTLAGGGVSGFADGSGAAARFDAPRDIAILGNSAYVADYNNDRIRKVDNLTGGSGVVSTLNVFPAITRPSGIAAMTVNGVNWLVVCSTQTHKVFLVNAANGQSFQVAGTGVAGSTDGLGNVATFSQPSDVAVVGSTIYVAELGGPKVRQISLKSGADLKFATSWIVKRLAGDATPGNLDGRGFASQFTSPRYLAVDGSAALFVTDLGGNRVRKITSAVGVLPITGPGGSGDPEVTVANPDSYLPSLNNAFALSAVFNLPSIAPKGSAGDVVDKTIEFTITAGTEFFSFYIAIAGDSDSIASLDAVPNAATPLKGSRNVNVRTLAGLQEGFNDGDPTVAKFGNESTQMAASSKAIYIADNDNDCIRRYDLATGITTTIAGLTSGAAAGGSGTTSSIPQPTCIWMNENETEGYVSGTFRRVMRLTRAASSNAASSNSWTVEIVAGTGVAGTTNGSGTIAQFGAIEGLTADPTGSFLYISDFGNNQIRSMSINGALDRNDPANWDVKLIAGDPAGSSGTTNGFGTAARFNGPASLVLSKTGMVYIAEATGHRIRRLELTTQVVSVAGSTAGTSGLADGTDFNARFNTPTGISLDESGFAYICDRDNGLIRRVNVLDGDTRTAAGNSDAAGSYSDFFGDACALEKPQAAVFVPGHGLYFFDGSHLRLAERVVRNGPQ
jgi:hypothetical protein